MSGFVPREVCYRCDKPQAMCLCARIPSVDNRTRVLVLQHPRERTHAIGTARLARLGLGNVRVEVAWNAGQREDDAPAWVEPGTALLYPSPGARDLHTLAAHEHPRQLLVLDGTWRTAAALYRDKTWLRRLPHVRFSPAEPSRYRLRQEPSREHVSTIEAIVEALRVLEPETPGLPELIGAFDSMIDEQLVHVMRREGSRRMRIRRPGALRRIPEAITGGFARMVIAYAESVRAGADGERALVQVSAYALASGALQQWHVLPRSGVVPDACMLRYMELDESDYAGALDRAAFCSAWDAFLRAASAQPIVAAWNQSSLELIGLAGARVPEPLVIKSAYRGRCGVQPATLEAIVTKLALPTAPNELRGRAAYRMACAAAVVEYLYALATAPLPSADAQAARADTPAAPSY